MNKYTKAMPEVSDEAVRAACAAFDQSSKVICNRCGGRGSHRFGNCRACCGSGEVSGDMSKSERLRAALTAALPHITQPAWEWVMVPREVVEIMANATDLKHREMSYAMEMLGFLEREAKDALSSAPAQPVAEEIQSVPSDTLDRLYIGRATEGDQLLAHNAILAAAPAQPAATAQEGLSEVRSLHERANAWDRVVELLNEIAPDWFDREGTGSQNAIDTIRELATRSQP